MSRLPAWPVLASLAVVPIGGCSSEGLSPVPTAAGTGGEAGAAPAPFARRVEIRNPLAGPADNLLVDGDFELSAVPAGYQPQSGVIGFSQSGRVDVAYETGGLCLRGLRCAVVRPDMDLFVQGAAAKDGAMEATFAVRPPPGIGCAAVSGVLFDCNTGFSKGGLSPASDQPARDGWCEYGGVLGPQSSATCLYIINHLHDAEVALVDAATLLPQVEPSPRVASPSPLTPVEQGRLEASVAWIQKHRGVSQVPDTRGALRGEK